MRTLIKFLQDKCYRLFKKIDLDRAVLLGILTRLWSIFAGVVTLLVIAYRFSPMLQGYYYTFLSIIAFQSLIELGVSNIIIQFASHEWAKLSLNENGRIVGDKTSLSRLQSLAQLFVRWYCIASIVLTMGLAVCGFFILSSNQNADINWILPWFFLCLCNGAIFCLLPIWSLLEGCNQILKLYSYRLAQGMFLSISLWIGILFGAQLWAVGISNMIVVICGVIFLLHKYKAFLKVLLFSVPSGRRISWYKEILPLQWRRAITWLVAPFAVNLFVPVLFKYHGPVIAGQMGMTLNLISSVAMMPSSWLNPKIPKFGMLISEKRYKDLDRLFWRTVEIFTAITLLGAAAAWVIVYILNLLKHPLALRFLPLLPAGIFILTQAVSVITVPFSTYLRVHKKEPILYVSVIGSIFIGLSTLILGKYYSATGMGLGYLIVMLFCAPLVFIIWHRCRIEWHKDEGYVDSVIPEDYQEVSEVI